MNACQWCGDNHGADRLCSRAQRGTSRRSFLFMFGAGIAAAAAVKLPWPDANPASEPVARTVIQMSMPARVVIHASSDGVNFHELAAFAAHVDTIVHGESVYGVDASGNRVEPLRYAPLGEGRYLRAVINEPVPNGSIVASASQMTTRPGGRIEIDSLGIHRVTGRAFDFGV